MPIPGHEAASIALYDRRTGSLLTGDTLYPGRLYVRDAGAFVESVGRLVEFTATRDVAHVLAEALESDTTIGKTFDVLNGETGIKEAVLAL